MFGTIFSNLVANPKVNSTLPDPNLNPTPPLPQPNQLSFYFLTSNFNSTYLLEMSIPLGQLIRMRKPERAVISVELRSRQLNQHVGVKRFAHFDIPS